MKKYKYESYLCSIATFGLPYVQHGETVEITDPRYLERKGFYLVYSVTTKFGMEEFRTEIDISIKVSK